MNERRKTCFSLLGALAILALSATGCSNGFYIEDIGPDTINKTADSVEPSIVEPISPNTTNDIDIITEDESVNNELTDEEIEIVTEPTNEWDVAKTSGDEVDFHDYFEVDPSIYLADDIEKGSLDDVFYYSEYLRKDRQAYIYTPPEYDTSKKYPVVYVFHGIGCDKEEWISMGVTDLLDGMIASGVIKPVIAVFPSIIPKDGLTPKSISDENIQAFTDFVQEMKKDLIPYVNTYYSTSPKRKNTAICGLSMGGMEALRIGFSDIASFDYIGSFSAAPTLDVELLKIEGKTRPPKLVLLCSGDADDVVEDNPMNYHLELEKNGVDHIWYQHPGGGHTDDVWELAFINFMTRAFAVEQ